MNEASGSSPVIADYLICRSSKMDDYTVWNVDITGNPLLTCVTSRAGSRFDRTHQLIAIGNYILEWGPIVLQEYSPCFPYRLFRFDPSKDNPLDGDGLVEKGVWLKKKFWGSRADFGNPDGPAKAYDEGKELLLLPFGTFVLNVIPTPGRGTFKLFSFDRGSADPLCSIPTPKLDTNKFDTIQGAFGAIQYPQELIPLGDYVLSHAPNTGDYCVWSFDPMNETVLARPAIQEGRWDDIKENHKLIPIGEYVLDWNIEDKSYRLWRFEPRNRNPDSENPLLGPERWGPMPERFRRPIEECKAMSLTCVQGLRRIDEHRKNVPGTIDFMRTRIKHIVYYMLENRAFDHVCGWLYEKGEKDINFIGHNGAFAGASPDLYNIDPDVPAPGNKVYLQKYGLDENDSLRYDPYHDMTDTTRHFFFDGASFDPHAYERREAPRMGGFIWNQGTHDVMKTFTPQKLPVLNGLAKAFAISDEWFCSMPGATDSQRAFALTGSALGQLNNFMNGAEYDNWPSLPHRSSIWKVLWANGYGEGPNPGWKIYNSVQWQKFILTYHLFLEGQIPTLDTNVADYLAGKADSSKYLGTIHQFINDAKNGTLPAFSVVEPVWIPGGGDNGGPATSYHPYGGGGTVPGEKALNDLYEALKSGPGWRDTLLIITFDEHGGFFDHVPPPYARKPWPSDENDGFRYDLMGVRVPTILVSPWIKARTVFRSGTPVPYDSTSILATLLHWHGIPKARWGLGERTHHAPTFEGVFENEAARSDAPPLRPRLEAAQRDYSDELTDLHRLIVPRLVQALVGKELNTQQTTKIANEILARSTDTKTLNSLINGLSG